MIVSHAYGIPSLWCNLGKTKLGGDDIKFDDYFSSVNISFYTKKSINFHDRIIKQSNKLFEELSQHSSINSDINKIQANLIKYAPFEVLDSYKK